MPHAQFDPVVELNRALNLGDKKTAKARALTLLQNPLPDNVEFTHENLVTAARFGDVKVFSLLFDHFEDKERVLGLENGKVLVTAAASGHLPLVEWLFEDYEDCLLAAEEANHNQALGDAAKMGRYDTVVYLISKPRIKALAHVEDNSALRGAASRGHANVMQLLIKECPEVEERLDDNNNHAVVLAASARTGGAEALKVLLGHPRVKKEAEQITGMPKDNWRVQAMQGAAGTEEIERLTLLLSLKYEKIKQDMRSRIRLGWRAQPPLPSVSRPIIMLDTENQVLDAATKVGSGHAVLQLLKFDKVRATALRSDPQLHSLYPFLVEAIGLQLLKGSLVKDLIPVVEGYLVGGKLNEEGQEKEEADSGSTRRSQIKTSRAILTAFGKHGNFDKMPMKTLKAMHDIPGDDAPSCLPTLSQAFSKLRLK